MILALPFVVFCIPTNVIAHLVLAEDRYESSGSTQERESELTSSSSFQSKFDPFSVGRIHRPSSLHHLSGSYASSLINPLSTTSFSSRQRQPSFPHRLPSVEKLPVASALHYSAHQGLNGAGSASSSGSSFFDPIFSSSSSSTEGSFTCSPRFNGMLLSNGLDFAKIVT